MEESLTVKRAELACNKKVREAVIVAMKSEINAKTEFAAAEEKFLAAEIAMKRAFIPSNEQKAVSKLINLKAQREAVIAEKQAFVAIQDSLYSAEIRQMSAQANAEKALAESNLTLEQIRIAALERMDRAEVQVLRAEAKSEEQKILADLQLSRSAAEARKIRSAAGVAMVRATAIAEAENAAADAESQNFLARAARGRARGQLQEIEYVVRLREAFEQERAPIKIQDYSIGEHRALMSMLDMSPIPSLDEIIGE